MKNNKNLKLSFPKSFWWGSATSGPQTEGAFFEEGKSETIWDHAFSKYKSRFFENRNVVNNFYKNYKGDIKIAKNLSFNSLRTSIQWARLIPDGKNVNKLAVKFYNNVIDEMVKNKITPVINLFHFDMPMWAQKLGGWENREIAEKFAFYAKTAFALFGDRVKHWTTFNEPIVPVEGGYLYDFHYPNVVSLKRSMAVQYNTMIAHHLSVLEFKKLKIKDSKIGIILNITPAIPRSNSKSDIESAQLADLFQWKCFADPAILGTYPEKLISLLKENDCLPEDFNNLKNDLKLIKDSKIDFLGINYYQPQRTKALDYIPNFKIDTVTPHTHFFATYEMPGRRMNPYRGWEIYPKSLYTILMTVKKEYGNIPCFISENGMGVQNEQRYKKNGKIQDDYRIDFFKEHLYWVHKAISEGSNCFGFHMWTYIDNWSWMNSYKNRYGFIELDVETGKRIEKKSASWFKKVSSSNLVDLDENLILDK